MGTRPDVATRFGVRGDMAESGSGIQHLVEAASCDIRRVVAGPHQSHGPGRHEGDAFVLVLEGDVAFTVDGRRHVLNAWDLLWVPAGAARGFVAGDQGAALLAVHLPWSGEGSAAGGPGEADQEVIARVTAHHAHMSARLERLAAAVDEAGDTPGLHAALSTLTGYWKGEILPHATAEETTFYAAVGGSAGAVALVEALVLEHADLRARVQGLAALEQEAATLAKAGIAAGPEALAALRSRAAAQAAVACALFSVHARKENEVVLPLLVAAGRSLPPILQRMELAFADAKQAVH